MDPTRSSPARESAVGLAAALLAFALVTVTTALATPLVAFALAALLVGALAARPPRPRAHKMVIEECCQICCLEILICYLVEFGKQTTR